MTFLTGGAYTQEDSQTAEGLELQMPQRSCGVEGNAVGRIRRGKAAR